MSLLWIIQLCIAEPLKALVVLERSLYDPSPASLNYKYDKMTPEFVFLVWSWLVKQTSVAEMSYRPSQSWSKGEFSLVRKSDCFMKWELLIAGLNYLCCQSILSMSAPAVPVGWCDALTLMEPSYQLHHFCQHQTDRTFLSQCLHCVILRSSQPRWN